MMHLHMNKACQLLGIGLTKFKKLLRRLGVQRWPSKRFKSIDATISYLRKQKKNREEDVERLEELRCMCGRYLLRGGCPC